MVFLSYKVFTQILLASKQEKTFFLPLVSGKKVYFKAKEVF